MVDVADAAQLLRLGDIALQRCSRFIVKGSEEGVQVVAYRLFIRVLDGDHTAAVSVRPVSDLLQTLARQVGTAFARRVILAVPCSVGNIVIGQSKNVKSFFVVFLNRIGWLRRTVAFIGVCVKICFVLPVGFPVYTGIGTVDGEVQDALSVLFLR